MRLAILGNSHTACMKHAIDKEGGHTLTRGHSVVFFASPANGMSGLVVDGDHLAPKTDELKQHLETTSGGQSVVNPDEFDAFLLVGMGYRLPMIDSYLSSALRRALAADLLRETLCWPLFCRLQRVTDKPVFLLHDPLSTIEPQSAQRAVSYDAALASLQGFIDRRNGHLLAQPQATRHNDLATKERFAQGSRRLLRDDVHHEDGEDLHMNADYGALVLAHFFDVVAEAAV